MHGVPHTARVEQRTGALQRLGTFFTLIVDDLLAFDELADMARKRDLHVDQVDFEIGRVRPIGTPVDKVPDGSQ
jgi:hypothetical protein